MSYLPVMHEEMTLKLDILLPLLCDLYYRGRVKYIDLVLC